MTWPRRLQFGIGRDPVKSGRKGGLALRAKWKIKWTKDYYAGYKAGFVAGRRERRAKRKLKRAGTARLDAA